MKVFWTPAINGEYVESAKVPLKDEPDTKIYARLENLFGKDYTEEKLDGQGWIKVKAVGGYFTYQQDDL